MPYRRQSHTSTPRATRTQEVTAPPLTGVRTPLVSHRRTAGINSTQLPFTAYNRQAHRRQPATQLSFTHNLNKKLHIISSVAKTAFMKSGVLSCPVFSSPQLLILHKSLVRPRMEYYSSHVLGYSTHTALLDRVESKAFHLINSPLTDYLRPLSPPEYCISC